MTALRLTLPALSCAGSVHHAESVTKVTSSGSDLSHASDKQRRTQVKAARHQVRGDDDPDAEVADGGNDAHPVKLVHIACTSRIARQRMSST